MKIYLVGGAVRDQLLHLPIKERDWVVVGATVEEMLRLGYRPVGKDFPVFLHPETNEEYALARTERKIRAGYTGFEFISSPTVTLEEDLQRRDLTINAMAQATDGKLIDPFHGKEDLDKKVLRHVSSAFVEDPVRILRVARFAARFSELGFNVAEETLQLMQSIVKSGEINALVAERVWKELSRALTEKNPEQFFQVLENCNALSILFPEIKINSAGIKSLNSVAKKTTDPEIRFAALLHAYSQESIEALCQRYRIPVAYRNLALLVANHLDKFQYVKQLNASDVLQFLQSVDAFRREERFVKYLFASECITLHEAQTLKNYYNIAKNVDIKKIIAEGFEGKELAKRIKDARIVELSKSIPI